MRDQQDWKLDALCRGSDVNKFFPEPGVSIKIIQEIKDTCNRCPVQWECLDIVLGQELDIHGIFGGKTPNDRRAIRAKARSANISLREASGLHDNESAKALDMERKDKTSLA